MRIVVDLQGAQGVNRDRGIGRYATAFTEALIDRAVGHDVVLLLNGGRAASATALRARFRRRLPASNIVTWFPPDSLRPHRENADDTRQIAAIVREEVIASLAPDVTVLTSVFEGFADETMVTVGAGSQPGPTAAILYDLIPLRMRAEYLGDPQTERWYLHALAQLERCDGLLAISEASRQDAIDLLEVRPIDVVDIRAAIDDRFSPAPPGDDPTATLELFGLDRPYLMYTGGIDPRKNVDGLIDAFARLAPDVRDRHQLVVVCAIADGERTRLLRLAGRLGLPEGAVVLTGSVGDDELLALYRACTAFVFPSLMEGFGLPVLEAMACGRPVIASRTSSMPEVVGDDDALFDPNDPQEISDTIHRVLTDQDYRERRAAAGLERSRTFSWHDSADRALTLLERIARSPRPVARDRRRRRLAYVSPLPPEASGIADYSADLLPGLARHYEIDVITDQPSLSDAWIRANHPRRTVQEFRDRRDCYDRVVYHVGNSTFHSHMFELLREIPGVVVLHDFFLSGIIAHLEGTGEQPHMWVRELQHSHGYTTVRERFEVADTADVVWAYPTNLRVLQDATGVIVHSRTAAEMADRWYGDGASADWAVVPMPRARPRAPERVVARQRLGIAADHVVVGSFGHVGPTKLSDRLIQAWAASPLASDPRYHLHLVGEATDPRMKQLVEQLGELPGAERVRVLGRVTDGIYRDHLAAVDVAVQLRAMSRGETSASALDCLNHGIATIVNANGSMAELPENTVLRLPDLFTDDELVEAMTLLVTDQHRRDALGRRGADHVASMHRPVEVARAMADAIEGFATAPHNRKPAVVTAVAPVVRSLTRREDRADLARSIARSFPPAPRRRQLLVDVSELASQDVGSGIQRVTRNVVRHLLANPPAGFQVEPVHATATTPYRYARSFSLRDIAPPGCLPDEPIEVDAGDVFLGLDLAPHVVPHHRRMFDGMRAAGVHVAFVVYDLLPIVAPEHFLPGARETYEPWLESIVEADQLIAISESVAAELRHRLAEDLPAGMQGPSVSSFRLGADLDGVTTAGGRRGTTAGPARILMVGTIEPRKRHRQAIDAIRLLRGRGVEVELVVVGKQGWLVDDIASELRTAREAAGSGLTWIERADDHQLDELYQQASGLLLASVAEGFGLPIVEAARHDVPLLLRDLPVFREIAGEHATFFAGDRPDDLADAIDRWLGQLAAGSAPTSSGMPRITWAESTSDLLRVLFGESPI